jgi:hypothetical protein
MRDGQLGDPLELAWLEQHLPQCDRGRAAGEAVDEAGISNGAMAPVVVFEWLRRETIARAAERMGYDWSDVPPWSGNGEAATKKATGDRRARSRPRMGGCAITADVATPRTTRRRARTTRRRPDDDRVLGRADHDPDPDDDADATLPAGPGRPAVPVATAR